VNLCPWFAAFGHVESVWGAGIVVRRWPDGQTDGVMLLGWRRQEVGSKICSQLFVLAKKSCTA
jgi:hypothetical protein